MKIIWVHRPPQSAMNPDRSVNTLLQTQIEHLHEAERNLPIKYRTEIYVKAIRTEGEAARYIRAVTEAIHKAHEDAAAQRMIPAIRRKRGIEIAAAADKPVRRRATVAKGKGKAAKRSRKT